MADDPEIPSAETRAQARELATVLTRRLRWRLWALTLLTILIGIVCCWYKGDAEPLARAGAVITVLTFGHAFAALQWNDMTDDLHRLNLEIFTQVEADKSLGSADPNQHKRAELAAGKRVRRVLPVMFAEVQRRFAVDHLLVGAIGTLIWGFGDLLPLAWLRAW